MKRISIWILLIVVLLVCSGHKYKGKWKITAYCACRKCCGKNADGITASGKKVKYGMVACNWLKFGTRVEIEGFGTFTVEDRGKKKYFGDKRSKWKHLDVFKKTHREAVKFGTKYKKVKILKKERGK